MSSDTPKFIVDFMLGKLARNLRLLGYDTEYIRHFNRIDLLTRLLEEERILLTRSHSFPKREDIYVLEIDNHLEQTKEVVRVFNLSPEPFTRCAVCNFPIVKVKKAEIVGNVPEYVFKTQDEFSKCINCGRIYWKGTHYEKIIKFIDKVIGKRKVRSKKEKVKREKER